MYYQHGFHTVGEVEVILLVHRLQRHEGEDPQEDDVAKHVLDLLPRLFNTTSQSALINWAVSETPLYPPPFFLNIFSM